MIENVKSSPHPKLSATKDSTSFATTIFNEVDNDDDNDIMLLAKVSDNQLAFRSAGCGIANGDKE